MYKKSNGPEGFYLIEMAVYSVCAMIIGLMIFRSATSIVVRLRSSIRGISSIGVIASACHRFTIDVHMASREHSAWKKISPNELIWQTPSGDIGWSFSDNKISRIKGTFDTQHDRWTKKHTSLIAHAIEKVLFSVDLIEHTQVKHSTMRITDTKKNYTCIAVPHLGSLYE
jgi:hypothetical protein